MGCRTWPHPRIQGALQPDATWDRDRIDADLTALEQGIAALRQRYEEIRANYQQQATLREQIQAEGLSGAEIQALQHQLEDLEATLASSFLSWGALAEPFWQAVRFGGVGMILGWILKAVADS